MDNNNKSNLLVELKDTFHIPNTPWKILENKDDSVVDGKTVLARARGPFFLVDGASSNKHHYTRKLWNNVLENQLPQKLEEGLLGAVGHDQPINDQAIGEGMLSHKVVNLWIDEDQKVKLPNGQVATVGMGELLILNTDSGRNLNTYIRAGVKLGTSSRAFGKVRGKTTFGESIIDENSFVYRTHDIVQNPGVVNAQLQLVESAKEGIEDINVNKKEDSDMEINATVLERLTEEKVKIKTLLDDALKVNETLTKERDTLRSDVSKREKQGTIEEILQFKEELAKYKEKGTIAQIEEAYEKIDKILEEYKDIDSPDDIRNTYTLFEEITKTLEDIGTLPEIERAVTMCEAYSEYGTPEDVEKTYTYIDEFLNNHATENKVVESKELANKHGIKLDVVTDLLSEMDAGKVDTILEKMKEGTTITSRYRNQSGAEKINEEISGKPKPRIKQTTLERLMSS